MYRSRSSLPYDILHGIQFPANLSMMFAYLSYFPPPPPLVPGPPPHRSWTCSSHSFSSLSCFVSDDHNLPSLREYIPSINHNQSSLLSNRSQTTINPSYPIKPSTFLDYIINLFQNHFLLISLGILILSILLILIFFFLLILYYQRHRQRQLTSNNKNKKFYYHLIPHRQKPRTTRNNNEQNLVRLRKDSPTTHVARISITSGKHTNNNNNNETEEAV